jgi:hypothetical protein
MGRIGACSKGSERWHREVVALINILSCSPEALYEGYAQKGFGFLSLDGSLFPLCSTATHEPTEVFKTLWGRWRSPNTTGSKPVDQEAKQHQTKEYQ